MTKLERKQRRRSRARALETLVEAVQAMGNPEASCAERGVSHDPEYSAHRATLNVLRVKVAAVLQYLDEGGFEGASTALDDLREIDPDALWWEHMGEA